MGIFAIYCATFLCRYALFVVSQQCTRDILDQVRTVHALLSCTNTDTIAKLIFC